MLGSGMEGGGKRQDPSVYVCGSPRTIILVPRRFLVLPGNSFGFNGGGEGRSQFTVGLYRVMARDSQSITRHTRVPRTRRSGSDTSSGTIWEPRHSSLS